MPQLIEGRLTDSRLDGSPTRTFLVDPLNQEEVIVASAVYWTRFPEIRVAVAAQTDETLVTITHTDGRAPIMEAKYGFAGTLKTIATSGYIPTDISQGLPISDTNVSTLPVLEFDFHPYQPCVVNYASWFLYLQNRSDDIIKAQFGPGFVHQSNGFTVEIADCPDTGNGNGYEVEGITLVMSNDVTEATKTIRVPKFIPSFNGRPFQQAFLGRTDDVVKSFPLHEFTLAVTG